MAGGSPAHPGKPDWGDVKAARFDPVAARQNAARWNFAPWADFRTYMDVSLARALDDLRHAAHELDSKTPVGIEGTQMPDAFGGYDLWRLSQVLDWVEPYDIGCARDILGSFMPDRPILTTVFEKDTDHARRRLWHLLLERRSRRVSSGGARIASIGKARITSSRQKPRRWLPRLRK